MRASRYAVCCVTLLLCSVVGCNRLSHAEAARLIEAHPEFQKKTRHIKVVDGKATKQCGIETGLWEPRAEGLKGRDRRATSEGKNLGIKKVGKNMVYLTRPVARLGPISVTAITEQPEDASATRQVVEFEYGHDVPEALSTCIGKARGEAVLIRDGDGWIVEEL